MKKLSIDLENSLQQQIYNKGQDIDVAIMSYYLDNKDFILPCLTMYQNKDGGFGHSLYIDNYNPNSTAFVTYYALKLIYLFRTNNKDEDLIIKKALTYLYHKALRKDDLFLIAEPSNNNFAHADYFTYPKDIDLSLTMGIIGLTILLVKEDNPYYKLALNLYNKYNLEINNYKENNKNIIYKAILIKGLNECNIDPDLKLDETKLDIFNILEINDFLSCNKELLDRTLDNLINTINNNGLWDYKLNWHNNYPEGDVAEIKWLLRQSVINYYYLKKYNLVETN